MAPGHLLLTPLLQGHTQTGWLDTFKSSNGRSETREGPSVTAQSPFSLNAEGISKISGGNCFRYSSKLHPAVTAQPSACCPCMRPSFVQLQWLLPCISAAFSVSLGSSVSHAHAVPHRASRPSSYAASTCLLFQWHLPYSGHQPQLLFPFIPKEGQRLSPLVSAFIVSRPPPPPPWWELEGTALARACCHAVNGGDGKKRLTAASFSSSLPNLVG